MMPDFRKIFFDVPTLWDFHFLRSMHRILLFCYLLFRCLASPAQSGVSAWMSMPDADSTAHVWFRHTALGAGRPQRAYVAVETTGLFKLYVNEYNVGTAAFYPAHTERSDSLVTTILDVTRYLRADTNVIALYYAPAFPHATERQLAVTFYGWDADGLPFCHADAGEWLCRPANTRWKVPTGEVVDGRGHDPQWKAAHCDGALWRPVQSGPARASWSDYGGRALSAWPMVTFRRGYRYFDRVGSGVAYAFGTGFCGRVRLTLRNAVRGDTIHVGPVDYICNGRLDEQAYPAFHIGNYRRVYVSGSPRFRIDWITDVEAVEIAPVSWSDRYHFHP